MKLKDVNSMIRVWLVAVAVIGRDIPFGWLTTCSPCIAAQVSAFQPIRADGHRHHDTWRTTHTATSTYQAVSAPSCVQDEKQDNEEKAWKLDLLQKCKSASTRATNPHKSPYMDAILQKLNSPAPQSFFVLQRALQRYRHLCRPCVTDSTTEADTTSKNKDHHLNMLKITASFLVKRGNKLAISLSTTAEEEEPEEDGLFWKLVPEHDSVDDTHFQEIWIFDDGRTFQNTTTTTTHDNAKKQKPNHGDHPFPNTLKLANQAVEIVTQASENQQWLSSRYYKDSCDYALGSVLVDQAMEQLDWTLGMDLRGRTSADAAFLFAMAGVSASGSITSSERLFQRLAWISQYELLRIGKRPSFYGKYILQMVEKHAAAGTRGPIIQGLYDVAADCLQEKDNGQWEDVIEVLRNRQGQSLDLLSPRPLLWLWKFSGRQKKAGTNNDPSSLSSTNGHINNDVVVDTNAAIIKKGKEDFHVRQHKPTLQFQDKLRPLVLDIGCGFGTSLLGLATTSNNDGDMMGKDDWVHYNFLGVDRSQLALNFAQGVATRWGLTNKLQYIWESAEDCLDLIETEYEGNVGLIMIQFPTPFRLDTGNTPGKYEQSTGNLQLPSDVKSGFMVSEELLQKVAKILSKSGGRFLFQSNCEDVAATVRQRAVERHGMKVVEVPHHVETVADMQNPTLRDLQWAELGGSRAIGPGWSTQPLLPPRGVTETEAACELNGTPIHRFIGTWGN